MCFARLFLVEVASSPCGLDSASKASQRYPNDIPKASRGLPKCNPGASRKGAPKHLAKEVI